MTPATVLFLFKGSEGRIVCLNKVPSNATKDDLISYKNLLACESHQLDDECCWGTVYRFKRSKWERGIEEKINKRCPEGCTTMKTTFYPMERSINLKLFYCFEIKTYCFILLRYLISRSIIIHT